MSYTVIITEEVAANIAVTTQNYPITIEYNATNLASGSSYGNANVAAYLASGTNSSVIDNIGNISTTGSMAASGIMVAAGNVIGGNIRTAGQVSASGNVTGAYILGNGSQLTGLPATYSDANVVTLLAAFGSNTISTTGNVTSGYIVANGSALTNLTGANVSGTVANATYATSAGSATTATTATLATYATTANAVAGANVSGTVANATYATSAGSATTAGTANTALNVSAANVTGTFGSISVTGNISSQSGNIEAVTGQFIGNGSGITIVLGGNVHGAVAEAQQVTGATQGNITSVGTLTSLSVSGNITGGNISTAGQISAGGNVAANNYSTSGLVTATGNITGGNVLSLGTVTAAGNLTSTQQTVIGTANVGTTGNIVISGKNIATDMAFNPDGGNAATAALSRIVVGTGWAGNITHNSQQQRLTVSDSISRTNTGTTVRSLASDPFVTLNGNVTNVAFRQQGLGAQLRIGGGPAANVTALTSGFGAPFSVAAGQFNVDVGNASPYNLGNTSISHVALNGGVLTVNGGSNVGNAYGIISTFVNAGTGTANVTNWLGYSSSMAGTGNVTGNMFCFYNGNTSTLGTYGVQTPNLARAAANYYFLRNDDDVAQNKLGSLRSYHEYQHALATSGTVNIDKSNAQVQYLAPTANVTIGDLQNFVTNASDSINNDPQSDSVTLIIKQGATPYSITMPTGNASIKYASNVSTVGTSANSVTMINITGANVAGSALYLVTVSPEFV